MIILGLGVMSVGAALWIVAWTLEEDPRRVRSLDYWLRREAREGYKES